MPELIKKFQEKHPKIKINMKVSSSKKNFEMLEKHQIEFGFFSHYVELDTHKYISEPFCLDHMVVVVSKDHPLATRSHCKISEIKNCTFIMKDRNASLNRFLIERLGGLSFAKQMTISTQEGIKQAVLHNLGISIMSEKSVEIEVNAGLIKTLEIDGYDLNREIHIIYHRKKHITPAGHAFLELCNNRII